MRTIHYAEGVDLVAALEGHGVTVLREFQTA
jgi:hypothetical protein